MVSKTVSEKEVTPFIPSEEQEKEGYSAKVHLPREWTKVCGFKRSEKCKISLQLGKHGYFIAVYPNEQIKVEDEFVTADKLETSAADDKTVQD